MRYIRSRGRPCVEATTCPTAARSTAVVITVHTGAAVSRILAVWWKCEAICAARRVKKSASLLTASIVFRVAPGEPIFRYEKCFSLSSPGGKAPRFNTHTPEHYHASRPVDPRIWSKSGNPVYGGQLRDGDTSMWQALLNADGRETPIGSYRRT